MTDKVYMMSTLTTITAAKQQRLLKIFVIKNYVGYLINPRSADAACRGISMGLAIQGGCLGNLRPQNLSHISPSLIRVHLTKVCNTPHREDLRCEIIAPSFYSLPKFYRRKGYKWKSSTRGQLIRLNAQNQIGPKR